jgi:hypothetical protein
MKIIGLTGKARAGKDTVADAIEEMAVGQVDREAFADRLKLIAALALGVSVHADEVGVSGIRRWADQFKSAESVVVLDARNTVVAKTSGREFLQRLGTEGIREVLGEETLLDAIPFDRDADLLILTDVRTVAEATRIRRTGGEVWRVNRPGAGAGNHRTERPIPDALVDAEVDNSGTITELWQGVRDLLALRGLTE